MLPAPAKNIDETRGIVSRFMDERRCGTDYVYAITQKANGEFIGLAGLHHLKEKVPELGIWTKLSSHGNHYGREAIGALIDYARTDVYKRQTLYGSVIGSMIHPYAPYCEARRSSPQ